MILNVYIGKVKHFTNRLVGMYDFGMSPKEGQSTRLKILEAAMEEIHLHGFQSTSLDQILERTQVSKGALYHHFKNKNELGLSLLDELIRKRIIERWVEPLKNDKDPIEGFILHLNEMKKSMSEEEFRCGCPLNNFSNEMSPLDPKFRKIIQSIYEDWIEGLSAHFKHGQEKGLVTKSLNSRGIAISIISFLEGSMSLTKSSQSSEIIDESSEAFIAFLKGLKPKTTQSEE